MNIENMISKSEKEKLILMSQPDWMDPMLATLTHEEFSDKHWIYERKLDGERCLVFKKEGKLRLMSRNKKKLNRKYPYLFKAFSSLDIDDFIIDGEIVAFDYNLTSFSKLQKRMHLSSEKEALNSDVDVCFYAFDIMYLDKYKLTKLALRERKKILKNVFIYNDPIRFTQHRNKDGLDFFKKACKKGWEGIIAKKADSQYKEKRTKKWLKFKCNKRQEFVIIGFTDPEGERIGFGALLLGYYDDNKMNYAGKVGTGFSDDLLKSINDKIKSIEVDYSPYDNIDISDKSIHWIKPKIVCEVSFTEWTENNLLRHPRFKGIRTDKNPKDVVNEDKRSERVNDDEHK